MKRIGKLIICLLFIVSTVAMFPKPITAQETSLNPEDIIKLIAPDGKNATFKVKKPTNIEEGDMLINGYVNNLVQVEGYEIYAGCYIEPYTSCEVTIRSGDYDSKWENGEEIVISGWKGSYTINVTYDEPKSNSIVDNYFNKLNNATMSDPSTYYYVEDLSLINYYLTSDKSELWNPGAPGRALKYSTLNNVTNGSNVTYYIDIRAGMQDETLMFESAFGPMSIFYNGYSCGTKEEGVYLKRVIYIPQDTENTKESYVAAAQKRINEYLGNENVVVSYGGLLSSLPADSEDLDYPITSDGNYYNIKIGNRTYKFYIVKALDEKLVKPVYSGCDVESNISITSEDSSVPLDTSITVNEVHDSTIKNLVGTDNYSSYDIELYSDASGKKITQLDNGKFIVSIPVPSKLEGKDLIVYYITQDGTKEEHEVTVKDGFAIFETDHFSIYTLAEKNTNKKVEDNPNTYDGITNSVLLGFICLIGLAGAFSLRKR